MKTSEEPVSADQPAQDPAPPYPCGHEVGDRGAVAAHQGLGVNEVGLLTVSAAMIEFAAN
jgi:hypothetical protein